MNSKKTPLRAVGADETPPPKKEKPQTVTQAASGGDRRALLVSMRDRIAKTVEDPNCPPRDLAALTRRLIEIAKDIEAIDAAVAQEEAENVAVEDEAFDSEAI